MKKWLLDQYLPMWAKETLLQDNRRLQERNVALARENEQLKSYIRGVRLGLRASKQGGNH